MDNERFLPVEGGHQEDMIISRLESVTPAI